MDLTRRESTGTECKRVEEVQKRVYSGISVSEGTGGINFIVGGAGVRDRGSK